MSPGAREQQRARVFGFASLFAWACLGMGLELAHAFKVSAYLDHPMRRELLLWGHAHGVGLALIVLAYAACGIVNGEVIRAGRHLRAAAVLMPAGFVLSVFGHAESDPGPAIWLVPLGAGLLLWGLGGVLRGVTSARSHD